MINIASPLEMKLHLKFCFVTIKKFIVCLFFLAILKNKNNIDKSVRKKRISLV